MAASTASVRHPNLRAAPCSVRTDRFGTGAMPLTHLPSQLPALGSSLLIPEVR